MRKLLLSLPLLALPLACSAPIASDASEDELTSVTARSRTLEFEAYVYVSETATDDEILRAVRNQAQSAFGALRTSEIGVNSRELKEVDPTTFVKQRVEVVDVANAGAPRTKMQRVSYRYTDDAVVPVSMAARSSLPSAVLMPGYQSQQKRVLQECTSNDEHAREFASSLWYVFEPSVSTCGEAMRTEAATIEVQRAKLVSPETEVSKSEATRLYVPITVRLGADKTNRGDSYPEYDRLFSGGVKPATLVIGMVNGFNDHGAEDESDSGMGQWIDQVRGATSTHTGWSVVKTEPSVDLANYDIAGKKVWNLSFADLLAAFADYKVPAGLAYEDLATFKKEAGKRIIKHFITLETKVSVSIGGKPAQPFTIQILTYFGASSNGAPHKTAIKNSDVYVYNGHSYIGYGPLDPKNFTASDFPASYQLLFIDSCVSYNYYEKDYIPLKAGGTKNLDLITNGLEAPVYKSGYALGQFVGMLIDGKQHSYRDLLQAASATDELRVVDGELDNVYTPNRAPITIR